MAKGNYHAIISQLNTYFLIDSKGVDSFKLISQYAHTMCITNRVKFCFVVNNANRLKVEALSIIRLKEFYNNPLKCTLSASKTHHQKLADSREN